MKNFYNDNKAIIWTVAGLVVFGIVMVVLAVVLHGDNEVSCTKLLAEQTFRNTMMKVTLPR